MLRSPLQQQVDTLPNLVRHMVDPLTRAIKATFDKQRCSQLQRIFVTGCGDSHHAAVIAKLAFEQLAGLPCEPMTAMQFARYSAGYLPATGANSNLLLAISVSGQVSRTVEALVVGKKANAFAVAITGNGQAPLATAADAIIQTAVPPLPPEQKGLIVPGSRSYIASQLALYLCAIQIGAQRSHLSRSQANKLRHELAHIADLMETTIAHTDALAQQTALSWQDANQFLFCGSGPNFGTALFTAAKFIEASGDVAIAQDIEEWAHLQYFGKQIDTPTVLISAGGWDSSRAVEVATAASHIGRRVAAITPANSPLAQQTSNLILFPISNPIRECFSPLLTSLPGTLLAAYRAQQLNEPYFRNFNNGRSAEGGGGISRIRTSHQITDINH